MWSLAAGGRSLTIPSTLVVRRRKLGQYGEVVALRIGLALVLAALVAALGALILGEYEFDGALPFVAGPLFGLVLGELVVGVGRSRHLLIAVLTASLAAGGIAWAGWIRSEEHTSALQSLMRISYAVFCLKKKKQR